MFLLVVVVLWLLWWSYVCTIKKIVNIQLLNQRLIFSSTLTRHCNCNLYGVTRSCSSPSPPAPPYLTHVKKSGLASKQLAWYNNYNNDYYRHALYGYYNYTIHSHLACAWYWLQNTNDYIIHACCVQYIIGYNYNYVGKRFCVLGSHQKNVLKKANFNAHFSCENVLRYTVVFCLKL